jgi:hypothetical protein
MRKHKPTFHATYGNNFCGTHLYDVLGPELAEDLIEQVYREIGKVRSKRPRRGHKQNELQTESEIETSE